MRQWIPQIVSRETFCNINDCAENHDIDFAIWQLDRHLEFAKLIVQNTTGNPQEDACGFPVCLCFRD